MGTTLPRAEERADLDARTRSDENVVYGLHAVQALITHQPLRIRELLIDDRRAAGNLAQWILELGRQGFRYHLSSREVLDRLAQGGRHQGVVARVRAFSYCHLDELVVEDPPSAVLVLDGVEDPRNLGASARAALTLGATGLVIPRDRAAQVTPAAEHVAAGALVQLPVAQVTNIVRALEELKKLGLWIVGAEADASLRPWEVDLCGPVAIVVGGEDRGVRQLVRRACDHLVAIPMHAQGIMLNAADAACVLLYELARQREMQQAPPPDSRG
ncbi:MAG: 23S rRNA (guanosine(2251)-2'-O)-methyltransferase RlmB [Pseudomonadota bacterium]